MENWENNTKLLTKIYLEDYNTSSPLFICRIE